MAARQRERFPENFQSNPKTDSEGKQLTKLDDEAALAERVAEANGGRQQLGQCGVQFH